SPYAGHRRVVQRPQRVHLGPQLGQFDPDVIVVVGVAVPVPAGSLARQRHQFGHGTGQFHDVGHEGGAALEGQSRHGDAPAIVDVAHHIGQRQPDVVVEDLAEVLDPDQVLDRADLHAWSIHVTDHPGDTAV